MNWDLSMVKHGLNYNDNNVFKFRDGKPVSLQLACLPAIIGTDKSND